MEMKSKLLFVPVVMVMVTASTLSTATPKTTPPNPTITTPKETTTTPRPTTTTPRPTTTTPRPTTTTPRPTTTTSWTTSWTTNPWTTGRPAGNLNGKMFTLSYDQGGVSFYPPYYSPSTPDYSTSSAPSWTTPPSTTGLSVCLRYLAEYDLRLFTLSPGSRGSLSLRRSGLGFVLDYGYTSVSFQVKVRLLPSVAPDLWSRVCVVIDSMRSVAQVFSGSYGSIRKMLRQPYSWTGEPVMDISGFDGQVTDVQVWDYELRYNEVINYMNGGVYRLYSGSVLSWSYISYSTRGKLVLEDVYEIQANQDRSRRRGQRPRPRGQKNNRRVFSWWQNKSSEKQRL